MGLQLPGDLISLLSVLGYTWPEADEEQLFRMGSDWLGAAGDLRTGIGSADRAAQQVWTGNRGAAITAFQQDWTAGDSPVQNLNTVSTSCQIVGIGMIAAAGIVLALKINVMVQLITLAIEIATAIAEAFATFGASLAEIPIFKEITGLIVDQLVNYATEALLNG